MIQLRIVIHFELHGNYDVFNDGTERTDQPREVGEHVIPFEGMAEDAESVGKISY